LEQELTVGSLSLPLYDYPALRLQGLVVPRELAPVFYRDHWKLFEASGRTSFFNSLDIGESYAMSFGQHIRLAMVTERSEDLKKPLVMLISGGRVVYCAKASMDPSVYTEDPITHFGFNQLMAQGTMARLGFDKKKYGNELQQAAAKAESDDAKLSPFATEVDPKTGERKVSEAAANDLRQFRRANAGRMTTPDGKPVDMVQLRATNPTEHARMATAQDSAFGLGRLFNKYAKDTTFGAQTGWGMPKISDMREARMKDWFKGMSAKDAALASFKPGYYSQGVEIDLGGRKQMVPIGEILNDEQNGGQYREMLNEWLVANGLPMLGNAVTGE